MKKLLVIDYMSLLYRSYYASNGAGADSVTDIFMGHVYSLARQVGTTDIVVAGEHEGVCFRHLIFKDYKLHREGRPDGVKEAMPLVERRLKELDINVLTVKSVEADDVIASICESFADSRIFIATSDKDLMCLIDDRVSVIRVRSGGLYEQIGVNEFVSDFGFEPSAMSGYLALVGDKADNIPGVRGIGEVAAKHLIKKYGDVSIVAIAAMEFENVEDKKERTMLKKVYEQMESLALSLDLVSLKSDLEIPSVETSTKLGLQTF